MTQFSFKGEFQYALDAKGRVSLPLKLRKTINLDEDRQFVLTRGMDGALLLYPAKTWKTIEDKLSEYSYIGSADNRAFIRIFLSWANELELDSQFRLNLPQRHLDFAGITNEIIILGLMDKIELWNPKTYQDYQQKAGHDYESIAGKIMGL